jgi:type VI secretion system protein ImpM
MGSVAELSDVSNVPETPGWTGKLSALGDFASRRLAADDVQWLDEWLSACVRTSQQQLGTRWMEVYLSAPLWRFVLGPGVMGPTWWCGVMMPSCDNVGRYFPLLVLQPRSVMAFDSAGLTHLDRWWAHLTQAAQHTLQEGATVQAFEQALHSAPAWPAAATAWPAVDAQQARRQCPVPQTSALDLGLALLAGHVQQRLHGHSLWWAMAASAAPAAPGAVVSLAGLPPPAAFASLLHGRW